MKIETQPLEDHQVKIIAEFEPSVLEKYKQQAARKISQNAKIPGFRPGKAPYAVIRRMYGEDAIQQEAVELMLDDVYPEVLKEADLKPQYQGSLDEIISTEPPKFSFTIPLNPEVELGDYRSIHKEFSPGPVTEEEVDAFIKRLQTSYSTAEPVERPVQEGDLVGLKLTGTLTQPEEGEEAELIHETPFQVVVGDEEQDTWPYTGFSKELLGMSAGDEKDVTYIYPEDSDLEKLRGKEIVFHAIVQSVKAMNTPEVNDEFAQSLGDYANVDALREAVRKQLEANKNHEYEHQYFDELVDSIVEGATIKYPPQMLEEEKDSVLRNIEQSLAQQRMDLDTYLKMIETNKEDFIANEVTPTAKRRLARSLVLDQIARDEEIKLEEGELQSAFNEAFMELQQTTDLNNMKKKISNERLSELLTYEAASRALNRRVQRRLKSIATGQPEETEPAEETTEETPEALAESEPVSEATQPETEGNQPAPENTEDNTAEAPGE